MRFIAPLTVASLIAAAFAGWIMNIVAFVHMLNGPITGLFVARAIGIPFGPLGVILGWAY